MNELGMYDSGPSMIEASRPNITERLTRQKNDLTARLEKVNAALTALKKDPDLQQIFDAISSAF